MPAATRDESTAASLVARCAAALVLLAAPCAAALAAPGAAGVAAVLEPIRARHDLPALAGAIVTTDGLLVAGATGKRRRGAYPPVTASDKWHLGSNTKAMTATLAARSVERGLLRWNSTLGGTFPELSASMHPQLRGATLEHLLGSRAGVAPNLEWWRVTASAHGVRDQRLRAVAMAGAQAPAFAPGSRMLYSNLGNVLAGAMIERKARDAWEELMKLFVFGPLNMRGCGFGGVGTPGQLDQPWGHGSDGGPVDRNGPAADNPPVMGPAGSVHCTLADWASFVADQLRGARGERALLRAESYRRLHTPAPGHGYALGWGTATRDWAGGVALTHNGSNTMNYSVAWLAPQRGFAVLVVSNQGGQRAMRGTDEAASALIRLHLHGR